MNQIKNYLESTNKLFEKLMKDTTKLFLFNSDKSLESFNAIYRDNFKSFIHQRQLGLIEVVKSLVSEEYPLDSKFGEGFNSCRSQILKNLEEEK